VRNLDRALQFYRILGFNLLHRAKVDDVAIIRNGSSVELNLIFNANAGEPNTNVLMAVPENAPATPTWQYNGAAWNAGRRNAHRATTMLVCPRGRHSRARRKRSFATRRARDEIVS
jgi:hypothetical protein